MAPAQQQKSGQPFSATFAHSAASPPRQQPLAQLKTLAEGAHCDPAHHARTQARSPSRASTGPHGSKVRVQRVKPLRSGLATARHEHGPLLKQLVLLLMCEPTLWGPWRAAPALAPCPRRW